MIKSFLLIGFLSSSAAAVTASVGVSPQKTCRAILADGPEALKPLKALDPAKSKVQIEALARFVAESYGAGSVADQAKTAVSLLTSLAKMDPKDDGYSATQQAAALALNALQWHGPYPSPTAKRVMGLWREYSGPEERTSIGLGKKEACLDGKDPKFARYSTELVKVIREVFGGFPWAKDLLARIGTVPVRPGGTKSFFAATVTMDEDRKNRLCVNPDEAPPLLLVRMMHEFVHATNVELKKLKTDYQDLFQAWVDAQERMARQSDVLDQKWEKFFEDLDLDVVDVTDNLEALGERDQSAIVEELASAIADAAPSDFLLNPKALPEMSAGLAEWTKELAKVEKIQIDLIKVRERLDLARYLDEHRAYAIDYIAGRALVAAHPEFFCRLWVPSFRYKRPIRYYKIFDELEEHIEKRTFAEWLAVKYTFESKSYIPSSLFDGGQRGQGLKPEVKAASEKALGELIPGWRTK